MHLVFRVGVEWPVHLECKKFPLKSEVQLCFGPNRVPIGSDNSTCFRGIKFTCPRHMKVPEDLDQGKYIVYCQFLLSERMKLATVKNKALLNFT